MINNLQFRIWFLNIETKEINIFTGTNNEWNKFSLNKAYTIKKKKKVKGEI